MIRHTFIVAMFAVASLAPLSAVLAAPGDTPGAPAAAAAAPSADATGKPGAVKPKAAVSAKQQAQRDKMKSCNADAKTKALKGADRKTFMSTCLKGG